MPNPYHTIISFLEQLRTNNNREWMAAHRQAYLAAKEAYETLTAELIAAIGKYDPTIAPLSVKECTFRLHRDTRFSHNKLPYKTHMGAYLARGGKKSGYGGYYLHLEPEGSGEESYNTAGGTFLAAGIYCPQPTILRSIREEILDNGAQLEELMAEAAEFTLTMESDSLKRTPRGFPTDSPYDYLLRRKHLLLEKRLDAAFFEQGDSATRIARLFAPTVPLVEQLNRAVEYAYEEMS